MLVSLFLTPADLKNILHVESSTTKEEGWRSHKKANLCEVWIRTDKDKPVNLVKVRKLLQCTQIIFIPRENDIHLAL